MKETQEIQVGKIVFVEPQAPALPAVPVAVETALALLVECPIRTSRVLDLETPEGWAWVEFQPWQNPDPIVPVPLLDHGHEFFEKYGAFVRHILDWSPRLSTPVAWSALARHDLERFEIWLTEAAVLPLDTTDWLLDACWRLWATPQGPQAELDELRRRSAAAVRRQREAVARARAERDRQRRERAQRQHELLYGGDGCGL